VPWTSHDCPVCGEEIRIEVLADSDDIGRELCYVNEWEGNCACLLTDEQVAMLENDACTKADWTIREID
jgi:hypothetical protein